MANCSPDVIWSLVKDTSCHVLKRKVSGKSQMGKAGVHLTLEPNNLTGINSFKYSGLANAKTVGIEPTEKGIVLTTKSRKSDRIRKVSSASSHACCGSALAPGVAANVCVRRPLPSAAVQALQQGDAGQQALPENREDDHLADLRQLLPG